MVLTRNGLRPQCSLALTTLSLLKRSWPSCPIPSALQQIREAESEIDRGDVVTVDRLRAKYQTRRLRGSMRSPVRRSAR